ncbi:MAG: FtsQ-type POTRA domain-containing protein [Clostridium sp.]
MEKSKKIRERRKKALRRRFIFFSSIILVFGAVIFFTKAPIFNIKYITFQGVKNVDKDELSKNVEFLKGKNIFSVGKSDIEGVVKSDQYISNIKIKKQGVNSIKLIVEESQIRYYYEVNENKYILNDKFDIVDVTETQDKENLVKIENKQLSHKNKGESSGIGEIEKEVLLELATYFDKMDESHPVSLVNIDNISNIKIVIGNIDVYLGNIENISNKLNMALNILDDSSLNLQAGYINVAVDGTPVIKKEEVIEEPAIQNEEDPAVVDTVN